ncbi:hypothetical protein PISMIDRAFT_687256 [Pisolithus microcarpus 441]|uniref:Uncharacterized protein n=1 Tax=Pisolithus microcarpus 441 TaxID=765257 RepID=A0A0C9XT10_9AGAM|nr:hypothetical protein BKA83DRAFT_687256 [Pisolithus microcarpus]KIK15450.1 hypothetical protein PISMIDRAFT_687256 [Pisolithus microcarpus 441]
MSFFYEYIVLEVSPSIRIIPGTSNAISRLPLTPPSRKPGFELYSTRPFTRCIFRRIGLSTSGDMARSLEEGFVGRDLE